MLGVLSMKSALAASAGVNTGAETMASLNMTRQTLAALLSGAMLATSAQAQTPAAPQTDHTVRDVTIIGGKIAPNTENPRSATCEFLVATDPFVRAQIMTAEGDPLMGPTFYMPTRYPRNVVFGVEPPTVFIPRES